jgi:uncharacterized membrane protein (UPF0127 family)
MGVNVRNLRVLNLTKGTVLIERGRVADNLFRRVVGLLRDTHLNAGEGLWIVPCNSIHSIGMKFRFDAVFLDRAEQIVHMVENMAPWRATPIIWSAHSVVELPAFTLQATQTKVGDQLELLRG